MKKKIKRSTQKNPSYIHNNVPTHVMMINLLVSHMELEATLISMIRNGVAIESASMKEVSQHLKECFSGGGNDWLHEIFMGQIKHERQRAKQVARKMFPAYYAHEEVSA